MPAVTVICSVGGKIKSDACGFMNCMLVVVGLTVAEEARRPVVPAVPSSCPSLACSAIFPAPVFEKGQKENGYALPIWP